MSRPAEACRYCGAEIPSEAVFCGNCGEDLAFQDESSDATARMAPIVSQYTVDVADTDDTSGVFVRIVGLFVVVGIGLASAVLIFLWIVGFFGKNGGDLGRAVIGGAAAIVALVFALLIGVVLAAIGGHYAAGRLSERGRAAAAAAFGAGIGHVLLIACLAGVLFAGVDMQSPPAPTPIPTELSSCGDTFGANSPLCVDESASSGDSTKVDFGVLAKGAAGVVPAALVGALVASILFERRRGAPDR